MNIAQFISHADYENRRAENRDLYGPNGWLLFVACDAGTEFAESVKKAYESALKQKYGNKEEITEVPFLKWITKKFEGDGHDGTCPRLSKHVRGSNAYVFQNVMDKREGSSSVNDNLKQLEQMICTLKAHGVSRVTAIIPYFPYPRQDKPSFMKREYPLARKVADALVDAKVDCVMSYHPHTTSIIGFFPEDRPFRYLSGLDLFVEIFSEFKNDKETIALSTDPGGLKGTVYLGNALGIDFGASAKYRPEQKRIDVIGILADLKGKKRVIITDDETATVSSCLGVIRNLPDWIKEIHVGISHMRLDPDCISKLTEAHERYKLKKLHTTDSVPQISRLLELPFIEVHSLAERWAFAINRMHYDMSVSELFFKPE